MNIERAGLVARRAAVGWAEMLAVAAIALPRWANSKAANAAPFEWPIT